MKKLVGIIIAFASFISTQSFASSININKFKKITKESTVAKDGTSTCFGNTL